jgi:hypothetical protein
MVKSGTAELASAKFYHTEEKGRSKKRRNFSTVCSHILCDDAFLKTLHNSRQDFS